MHANKNKKKKKLHTGVSHNVHVCTWQIIITITVRKVETDY